MKKNDKTLFHASKVYGMHPTSLAYLEMETSNETSHLQKDSYQKTLVHGMLHPFASIGSLPRHMWKPNSLRVQTSTNKWMNQWRRELVATTKPTTFVESTKSHCETCIHPFLATITLQSERPPRTNTALGTRRKLGWGESGYANNLPTGSQGSNTQRANLQTNKNKMRHQATTQPLNTKRLRTQVQLTTSEASWTPKVKPNPLMTKIHHWTRTLDERAMKAMGNTTWIGQENTPPYPNKHKRRATSISKKSCPQKLFQPFGTQGPPYCCSLSAPWGFVVGYLLINDLGEVFMVSISACHASDPSSIPDNGV